MTLSGLIAYRVFRRKLRPSIKQSLKQSLAELSGLSSTQRSLVKDILFEAYESALFKAIAGSPAGALTFPFWLWWFNHFKEKLTDVSEKELRRFSEIRTRLRTAEPNAKALIASAGE
jgi:hypothetical protein